MVQILYRLVASSLAARYAFVIRRNNFFCLTAHFHTRFPHRSLMESESKRLKMATAGGDSKMEGGATRIDGRAISSTSALLDAMLPRSKTTPDRLPACCYCCCQRVFQPRASHPCLRLPRGFCLLFGPAHVQKFYFLTLHPTLPTLKPCLPPASSCLPPAPSCLPNSRAVLNEKREAHTRVESPELLCLALFFFFCYFSELARRAL